MISTNEFKTHVTVTIDGDAWQVVEFQHVKPGKGAAFVRAKMRNMCTGAVVERTFNAGERLPKAHIDRRAMQYLYESDGNYVFMDNETYEQSELTKEQLGNAINFLKEIMDGKIMIPSRMDAVRILFPSPLKCSRTNGTKTTSPKNP